LITVHHDISKLGAIILKKIERLLNAFFGGHFRSDIKAEISNNRDNESGIGDGEKRSQSNERN
jgi:hypothetical protein